MPLRVAAVGVNHWHSLYDMAYLGQLKEMPDVDLVAIQDDDPQILAHRTEALGGGVAAYSSYHEMLSDLTVDLVLVLDRHDRMAGIVAYLLEHGIAFIVEKPACFNAKELSHLAQRAQASTCFAGVPLIQRLSPFVEYARELLTTGSLGDMRHFYYRLNRPTSSRYPGWGSAWMLDPARSNGGCLRNLGSHGLDCFAYLTEEGDDIEVTAAQLSWDTHNQPVEDYASVLLRTGRGVLGTVEVGNVFPSEGRDADMKIDFERGILRLEGAKVRLYTADGVETLSPAQQKSSLTIERWVRAMACGAEPPASLADCHLAVRLIDLAYLAAGNPYGTAAV
jgi:predicted dehydrogenase